MTIEERVEKIEKKNESLERQNRKLKRLSLASIALALAALIGGTALSVRAYTAAIEPDSITTKAIYLKDSSNRIRLHLSSSEGSVRLYDPNGKLRSFIAAGYVQVYDPNGGLRVVLSGSESKITFKNASGYIVKTLP